MEYRALETPVSAFGSEAPGAPSPKHCYFRIYLPALQWLLLSVIYREAVW